ncbi:MAG: RidA family protein [Planctomycetia bacterium]|jgi:reactive intermediate/imine deaminase
MKRIGDPVIGPSGNVLPFSAGVEVNGMVFVSGQLPMKDGKLVGDTIEEQTAVSLDGLEAVLKAAGLGMEHVVKANIWITDAAHFPGCNAVYSERFNEPYPARATVISGLALPGAMVEIDAIAVRP